MAHSDWLYKLSGHDPALMQQCDEGTGARCAGMGALILFIFALCFAGSYITLMQVFDNPLLGILLSVFFSWMIINIYRLLLYTLAKNSLPQPAGTGSVSMSLVLRLLFVCFIAIVVSKPLESVIYDAVLDRDIAAYKVQIKRENSEKIAFYYRAQLGEIKRMADSEGYKNDFVTKKRAEQELTVQKMYGLINASDYYLQRLRFLYEKHSSSWLVTLLIVLIFLLPVFIKYRMKDYDYYNRKGSAELDLVQREYQIFKEKYTTIFAEHYHGSIVYSEPYENPPFNTVKKRDKRKFHSAQDLLSELYK